MVLCVAAAMAVWKFTSLTACILPLSRSFSIFSRIVRITSSSSSVRTNAACLAAQVSKHARTSVSSTTLCLSRPITTSMGVSTSLSVMFLTTVPPPWTVLHHAEDFQFLKSLSHGRPTDPHLLSEFTFRGESIPDPEQSLANGFLQLIRDLIGNALQPNRFKDRGLICVVLFVHDMEYYARSRHSSIF